MVVLFLNDLLGLFGIHKDEDCEFIIVEGYCWHVPLSLYKLEYLCPLLHQEARQNNELPCSTEGFTQKYSEQNNRTYHLKPHNQNSSQMA